jgi:hypothetical protein
LQKAATTVSSSAFSANAVASASAFIAAGCVFLSLIYSNLQLTLQQRWPFPLTFCNELLLFIFLVSPASSRNSNLSASMSAVASFTAAHFFSFNHDRCFFHRLRSTVANEAASGCGDSMLLLW